MSVYGLFFFDLWSFLKDSVKPQKLFTSPRKTTAAVRHITKRERTYFYLLRPWFKKKSEVLVLEKSYFTAKCAVLNASKDSTWKPTSKYDGQFLKRDKNQSPEYKLKLLKGIQRLVCNLWKCITTCLLTLIDSICPNSSNKLVKSCCVAFLSTWPTQRVVLQTVKRQNMRMLAYKLLYGMDIKCFVITQKRLI